MRALLVLCLGLSAVSCGEAEVPVSCDSNSNCHPTEMCIDELCKLRSGEQCLKHRDCATASCVEGYCQ